jgi:hypothetical protein
MPLKTRDLLTRSWQSQANLSLFLLLLILAAFLLPSVGFEKNSLHFYDDAAASVVAVARTAIVWRNRKLFLLTSVAVIVAIAFRGGTWWRPTQTVRLWSALTVSFAKSLSPTLKGFLPTWRKSCGLRLQADSRSANNVRRKHEPCFGGVSRKRV